MKAPSATWSEIQKPASSTGRKCGPTSTSLAQNVTRPPGSRAPPHPLLASPGGRRYHRMIGRTRMPERMRSDGEAAGGTPARRRNRFAQVVDELGRRVVSGDFDGSGALPIEPQLAAELGVSRNLLREAVKVLAGKG